MCPLFCWIAHIMSAEKTKRKQVRFNYPVEAMQNAIQACRQQKMSINKSAKTFGVPKTTLLDKLSGKYPEYRRMGPDTVLTTAEEKLLEDWLFSLAKKGFPRKRSDLLSAVQAIIKADHRKTPFKDDRPGRKWYNSFLRRHPTVANRTPEAVTKARAAVTEHQIRYWFKELHTYLEENGWLGILDDAKRILNADETNFQLCPKTGTVLAPRGWKNVYDIVPGSEKDALTVLASFSADGKILPGMIVYPYIRPPRQVVESVPEGWAIGRSESGWMRAETFYEYVANVLKPWLDEHNIPRPVLFLLDGHKSHLTYHLSEFCAQNDIILYSFIPNATHILQPADVGVFKPMKTEWKSIVHAWQADNTNKVLSRCDFAPLVAKATAASATPETIKNGFKACGLFPFNENAVDYSKCLKASNLTAQQGQQAGPTEEAHVGERENSIFPNFHELELKTAIISVLGEEVMQNFETSFEEGETASLKPESTHLYEVWKEIKIATQVMNIPAEDDRPAPIGDVSGSEDEAFNTHNIGANLARENDMPVSDDPTPSRPTSGQIQGSTLQQVNENVAHHRETSQPAINEVALDLDHVRPINLPGSNSINKENELGTVSLRPGPRHKTVSSAFNEHLFWPKTPEKKKQRITEKLPHAISSGKWRDHFKQKDEELKKKREAIDQRKKERKEKKLGLQPKPPAKTKAGKPRQPVGRKTKATATAPAGTTQQNMAMDLNAPSTSANKNSQELGLGIPIADAIEVSGNECMFCSGDLNDPVLKEIVCALCKSTAHIVCIPSHHKAFFPDINFSLGLNLIESDSEQEYECPACFYVNQDEDDDTFVP